MQKKEVEMRYYLEDYCHHLSIVFDLIYRLYGTFAFVLIYETLKNKLNIKGDKQ